MKHVLTIHSLHDGRAACSCGKWEFTSAGATTREHILDEFHIHRVWNGRSKARIKSRRRPLTGAQRAARLLLSRLDYPKEGKTVLADGIARIIERKTRATSMALALCKIRDRVLDATIDRNYKAGIDDIDDIARKVLRAVL